MLSEKQIYNTYLRTSRTKNGLPYKPRKRWEGFEESALYLKVLKLRNFFNRNSSVNVIDFFDAPYTIYPGESGFDLDFYASQKAIKIYTLFLKKQMMMDPDQKYHLEKIIKGLNFIKKFCKDNNILVSQYLKHKNGMQFSFIIHLKDRLVSIYNLFAFDNFDSILSQCDPDLLRFTLNDLYDKISIFRTKFLASKTAKNLAIIGIKKISKIT